MSLNDDADAKRGTVSTCDKESVIALERGCRVMQYVNSDKPGRLGGVKGTQASRCHLSRAWTGK